MTNKKTKCKYKLLQEAICVILFSKKRIGADVIIMIIFCRNYRKTSVNEYFSSASYTVAKLVNLDIDIDMLNYEYIFYLFI